MGVNPEMDYLPCGRDSEGIINQKIVINFLDQKTSHGAAIPFYHSLGIGSGPIASLSSCRWHKNHHVNG